MERKVALVTGAAKGIGAATVRALANNGYSVVIHYNKSEEKALLLMRELLAREVNCTVVKADLSVRSEAESLYGESKKCFGFVDTVINNAGVCHFGLLTDDGEAEYRRVMDSNFGSAFNVTGLFARDMVSNQRGKIINIASVWGSRGAALESLYSASKSALIGYTKAAAKELITSGVTVNCLLPGYVKTDMNARFDEEEEQAILRRMRQKESLTPEDVANAILTTLSQNPTGKILPVNSKDFIIK